MINKLIPLIIRYKFAFLGGLAGGLLMGNLEGIFLIGLIGFLLDNLGV